MDFPYIVTCVHCRHAAYRVFNDAKFYACPGCMRCFRLGAG